MLNQEINFPKGSHPFIFIIPLGTVAKKFSIILAKDFRHHKIPTEIDLSAKKIQKSIQLANKLKADNILIIGENEMTKKQAQFKNLQTREQQEVPFDNLKNFIKNKYYNL